MRNALKHGGLVMLLVLLFAGSASGVEVFLWDNDNNIAQQDPVFNQSYTATQALARALEQLDIPFETSMSLPEADELIGEYDMMMTALGYLCPG